MQNHCKMSKKFCCFKKLFYQIETKTYHVNLTKIIEPERGLSNVAYLISMKVVEDPKSYFKILDHDANMN